MKNIFLSIAVIALLMPKKNDENFLIVGTYTGGKSEGIYVMKFNSATGDYQEVSHVIASNPSFLTVSADKKTVYAVNENSKDGNGGEISAYAFDKETGTLSFLNKQFTQGDSPCYVELDKTGKWVFAANYSSGSFSEFPVNADGSIGQIATHIQHTGTGKNKERQEKAHVHCTKISSDNKLLSVPDLGIDKMMIYAFDANTGKLTAANPPFFEPVAGSGPRHFTYDPSGKHAYLIEELTGTVEAFNVGKGKFQHLQRISTIKAGEKGFAGSADIHVSPDGKFLYASNRGDFNNIAIFKINPASGKLTSVGFQSTFGKAPRNFDFDPSGNYLLVGNQDSDEIVVFNRNKITGLLTDSGKRIPVGKPVCLKWITN